LTGWQAARRTTPGGQARYSDAAIELVLMLRLVFHLALCQAEGFAASALRLLGQALRVPDHTTLSGRSHGFAGRQPKIVPHRGPLHLVIDSTGLKLFGRGEWDLEKHGWTRRSWLKLHLCDGNTYNVGYIGSRSPGYRQSRTTFALCPAYRESIAVPWRDPFVSWAVERWAPPPCRDRRLAAPAHAGDVSTTRPR
jgi:hypothetical protein